LAGGLTGLTQTVTFTSLNNIESKPTENLLKEE
jgi:hypothetical protein